MALSFCSDLSPASWIVASDLPWPQLVGFGPSGFAAYARLRFLPDPACQGQSENDVALGDGQRETDQLRMLFEVLATRTRTPNDCYFCLWDGFGFSPSVPEAPTVVLPDRARAYFLFHGALSDAGDWSASEMWPGQPPEYLPPAFVWPADHAWCVANDVDPHWAGIGADAPVIHNLVADPRLDVVPADPSDEQPSYE